MREIRISGKNESIVASRSARAPLPPRRAGALVTPAIAAAAVAVALLNGPFASAPTPIASPIENPPSVDAQSGKIVDRAAPAETAPIYASATLLFGHFLDTSLGPPAVLASTQAPAASAPVAAAAPAMRKIAKAAPLPPVRPAALGDPVPVAVASAEPSKEASRMLGFIPEDLLGTPRRALRSVASLGESLLERVIP
jgi:hypothetical protein